MKKIVIILMIAMLIPMVCACGSCDHRWTQATCNSPAYCEKCGITNGNALGHDWIQSSENARTCSRCGVSEVTGNISSSSSNTSDMIEAPSAVQVSTDEAVDSVDDSAFSCPSLSDLKEVKKNGHIRTKSDEGVMLQLPKESQMLSEPFRAIVDSGTENGSIYVMPIPLSGNGNLGRINNGTEVWIVAEAPYYYFFYADNGQMGWNTPSRFRIP